MARYITPTSGVVSSLTSTSFSLPILPALPALLLTADSCSLAEGAKRQTGGGEIPPPSINSELALLLAMRNLRANTSRLELKDETGTAEKTEKKKEKKEKKEKKQTRRPTLAKKKKKKKIEEEEEEDIEEKETLTAKNHQQKSVKSWYRWYLSYRVLPTLPKTSFAPASSLTSTPNFDFDFDFFFFSSSSSSSSLHRRRFVFFFFFFSLLLLVLLLPLAGLVLPPPTDSLTRAAPVSTPRSFFLAAVFPLLHRLLSPRLFPGGKTPLVRHSHIPNTLPSSPALSSPAASPGGSSGRW
ncbi:uncharacterized protein ARB_05584 [Trichophyton benhamiae CBS 112371]|uniref:Uncharacterized protein n=1 Tax=Arthroderma benhamiae (strain ATCC MYA-4681 / CBS 112371) TaxID=663331 RepID=D4AMY1_ARTBC|nr:uncharacterized protein ARB_05584 [Trichophyton benhamiae CBS 112371]EFE35542.1 hypothetical protein ARB_05584 [Trichophyton benhamiae CBS 112371]